MRSAILPHHTQHRQPAALHSPATPSSLSVLVVLQRLAAAQQPLEAAQKLRSLLTQAQPSQPAPGCTEPQPHMGAAFGSSLWPAELAGQPSQPSRLACTPSSAPSSEKLPSWPSLAPVLANLDLLRAREGMSCEVGLCLALLSKT